MEMHGWEVGDLGQAVRWETRRILHEARGDRNQAMELALERYVEEQLISEAERDQLTRILRIGVEAGMGTRSAESAYIEVRHIHHEILAKPAPSPMATTFASTTAGSYLLIEEGYGDEEPKVVFAKKSDTFEDIGGIVGGLIGNKLLPGAGAVLGFKIGSAIGGAVDECLEGENGEGGGAGPE